MALRRRADVSGEFEAFVEKPGKLDVRQMPFELKTFSVGVGGHKVWLEPELNIEEQAKVAEGLTDVVGDANALDRNLAVVYSALRAVGHKCSPQARVLSFRHGEESEVKDAKRTVVGGHIQYHSPEWRRSGELQAARVVRDSHYIRAYAVPFIFVDGGVERVLAPSNPCQLSDRLYLREKTVGDIPRADRREADKLPRGREQELVFSAESVHHPDVEGLRKRISLEVRCPPSGPAMGKHALDVLVAVSQASLDGGFRAPSVQNTNLSDPDDLERLERDKPRLMEALKELKMKPDDLQLIDLSQIDTGAGGQRLWDTAFILRKRQYERYGEYSQTCTAAARDRYRAVVVFSGDKTLLRDAYAAHYLKNRDAYDGADPAIREWVRAATDNGFSYTDFRMALRGFIHERGRFNMVADGIMSGNFSHDAAGKRPRMSDTILTLPDVSEAEREFLGGLAVFLAHRFSGLAPEGSVPAGVEDVGRGRLVRVAAADGEGVGRLLDAGYMFADSGRLPGGRGYFDLAYAAAHPRSGIIREGLGNG
jgi:hypothetical protein